MLNDALIKRLFLRFIVSKYVGQDNVLPFNALIAGAVLEGSNYNFRKLNEYEEIYAEGPYEYLFKKIQVNKTLN